MQGLFEHSDIQNIVLTPDKELRTHLVFSTNPFLHSSSIFPPTGLTPRTPAVFRFLELVGFNFGTVC